MDTLIIIMLSVAIVTAIGFIIFSNGQKSLLSLSLKSIASFAFSALALCILYIKGISLVGLMFMLGFIASCFGDVVLALPDMTEMKKHSMTITLIGGLCFAVAHIFYIVGMILSFGFVWWTILIALALGLVFCYGNQYMGKLDYGSLKLGMPVYSIFVSLVVAFSIASFVNGANATGAGLLFAGFVLFWLSDIVLMHIYFGNKPNKNTFLYYFNLAFYYGAQIMIASSLYFLL